MEKFCLVIFDEELKKPVVMDEVDANDTAHAYYEFYNRGYNVPLIMDQESWEEIRQYNSPEPLFKVK